MEDLQPLGKSKLAVELAKKINGEIISADSMQIYKDMNIGTAKITKEEMQGIKHYMLDIIEPNQRYNVSEYKNEAQKCIEEILKKGKTPIIVGGTGLYIDVLIYEIEFQKEQYDEEYRKMLENIAQKEGLEKLYEKAKQIDPKAMEKISKNDKKRIIRVLEIYHKTGKTKTEQEIESRKKEIKYNYHVFAIDMNRQVLYERINKRVDIMIENGLLEEAKKIYDTNIRTKAVLTPIGYKELFDYFDNKCSLDEAIEIIKQRSRRYAKRQYTWNNHQFNLKWFNVNFDNFDETINEVVNYIGVKNGKI